MPWPSPLEVHPEEVPQLVARRLPDATARSGAVYVSRAGMHARLAGEAYLEQVMRDAGVHVIRPETLPLPLQLEAYATERYVSPLEFAWIHFALGDTDLGFKWLAKAGEDRTFDILSIKVDHRFDPFRDDRRFVALAKQLGVD